MRQTVLASLSLGRTALSVRHCPEPQYKRLAVLPSPSLSLLWTRSKRFIYFATSFSPFIPFLFKSVPRTRRPNMCHYSQIDRACGHFDSGNITTGSTCKTLCKASKSNTTATAGTGNCSRCHALALETRQSGGRLNGLGISGIANKLSGLQVSAQSAPPGAKLAPNLAPLKEKLPSQVATKPSGSRPGQKPAPSSATSGRPGQGTTSSSSAAAKASASTSQTRLGNRGVPAVN